MTQLTIKNVRLRYNNAFKADQYDEDAKLEYSATVLIPGDHPQVKAIKQGIHDTMVEFFGKKVPLKRHCLRDGEEKMDKAGFEEGMFFLKAGNESRPPIYNSDGSLLVAEDGVLEDGSWIDLSVGFFAYDHPKGGKGVSASFRGLRFVRSDEAFAGGVASENEFDFIEGSDPMDDEDDLDDLVG